MALLRRLSKSLMRLSRQVTDPLSTEPLVLFDFKTREDVENNWRVSSDASFGGCSSGHVSLVPCDDDDPSCIPSDSLSCMRFQGVYSRDIDTERAHPRLRKSGFVSMTGRRMDSLDTYMDLECYKSLVYSIRVLHPANNMEGERTFLANIRTDNWVIGGDGASEDIWQAVLHTSHAKDTTAARRNNQPSLDRNSRSSALHPLFVDVEIPLSEFILTWRGRVVDAPVEIGRTKITALGISLLGNDDQQQGPFCIDVLQIKALHESDASSAYSSISEK